MLNSIHAFGASHARRPVPAADRDDDRRVDRLVASRAESLRSEHRLDSLLSREAIFLLNNLLLVALCFVVFWGTFFPLIAEAVTGRQRNIGPPVYEQFVVPLALLLVLRGRHRAGDRVAARDRREPAAQPRAAPRSRRSSCWSVLIALGVRRARSRRC